MLPLNLKKKISSHSWEIPRCCLLPSGLYNLSWPWFWEAGVLLSSLTTPHRQVLDLKTVYSCVMVRQEYLDKRQEYVELFALSGSPSWDVKVQIRNILMAEKMWFLRIINNCLEKIVKENVMLNCFCCLAVCLGMWKSKLWRSWWQQRCGFFWDKSCEYQGQPQ